MSGTGTGPARGEDVRPGQGPARRGAFTLVEVIVALVLLTVGLLASVSMMSLAAGALGEARRVSLAAAAAESLADSLLRAGGDAASGSREHPWGVLRWGPGERPGDVRIVAARPASAAGREAAGGEEERSILVELVLRPPPAPTPTGPGG